MFQYTGIGLKVYGLVWQIFIIGFRLAGTPLDS